MKTLLAFICVFCSSLLFAQPTTSVYYGCGGATVVTFPGDVSWQGVTYQFQRQTGITWTTVLTKSGNFREGFHLVLNGELNEPTQYRCIVRNDITLEERISNGVLVNPARFNETVVPPQPVINYFWGSTPAEGNYIEVLPRNIMVTNMRPPFTIKYRKQGDAADQIIVSTTGVFITNVEANVRYVISVEDFCGNVVVVNPDAQIRFSVGAVQTGRNCSGGTITATPFTNVSANINFRRPYTYACVPLPSGLAESAITPAFLQGLPYAFTSPVFEGLDSGRYVVCVRDAFGTLSEHAVVRVVLHPDQPFIISSGPSPGYCRGFVVVAGSPAAVGIRLAGSNVPYVFTNGNRIENIPAGRTYEIVSRDTCGRVGRPLIEEIPAWLPVITEAFASSSSSSADCTNEIVIRGNVCSTPLYGLLEKGTTDTIWQTTNRFVVPKKTMSYDVFLRDSASKLTSTTEVVVEDVIFGDARINLPTGCEAANSVIIEALDGKGPFLFALGKDSINFTQPVPTNLPGNNSNARRFDNLAPGKYFFKIIDACGIETSSDVFFTLGPTYYVKEATTNQTCVGGTPAGGFISVGLRPDVYNLPPFTIVVKEATRLPDGSLAYGPTLQSFQADDTTFTISGLPFGKQVGLFITDNCGNTYHPESFGENVVSYEPSAGPFSEVLVQDDAANCAAIWIAASTLASGQVLEVFKGRDTTGQRVSMQSTLRTVNLSGGFYTARIRDLSNPACVRERLYPALYVLSEDSTSAGTPLADTVFVPATEANPFGLFSNLAGASPGGVFTADGLINLNTATGYFIPAIQQPNNLSSGDVYTVLYTVEGKCRFGQSEFKLVMVEGGAVLGSVRSGESVTDEESAAMRAGCNGFSGDKWHHVFNDRKQLVMSIRPGSGNTLTRTCWGARYTTTPLRTTSLGGTDIYFAARNFYVEPASAVIGGTPVRVRMYFTRQEIQQLLQGLQQIGYSDASVNQLRILKKQGGIGSPVNLEIGYDPGASLSLYKTIVPSVADFDTYFTFEFEVDGFSEFGLAFNAATALPVTWLRVEGSISQAGALIQWSTASEANTASFVVEHSVDGRLFTAIGSVMAAGNSSQPRHYQFLHRTPGQANNFYRIKQIDRNAVFAYSKTVRLSGNGVMGQVTVFPNPASRELILSMPVALIGQAELVLTTVEGKQLWQRPISRGARQVSVDVSGLSEGTYWLVLKAEGRRVVLPFVKRP